MQNDNNDVTSTHVCFIKNDGTNVYVIKADVAFKSIKNKIGNNIYTYISNTLNKENNAWTSYKTMQTT